MYDVIKDLLQQVNRLSVAEREEFMRLAAALPPMADGLDLEVHEEWWLRKLDAGSLYGDDGWTTTPIMIEPLTDDFTAYTRRYHITKRGNATAMGRYLKKVCPLIKKSSRKAPVEIRAGDPGGEGFRPGSSVKKKKRIRHYQFPTLDVCRLDWERRYGARDWADSGDSGGSADDAQKGDSQYPDGD